MKLLEQLKTYKKNADKILSLNRRNQFYQRQLNTHMAKKIADNKLLTKRVLRRASIPTPEIYKVIRTPRQLEYVNWENLPKSFVVKPNQGSRGRGILIIYGRKRNKLEWIKSNGEIATVDDMKNHILKIFEGRFSLGNRRDIALIEDRLQNDKVMDKYSYKGVPDIRIIVYNKIPIMAAARFPTAESQGKANLHAGALYVGIDISNGITTNAIHLKSKSILQDTYEFVDETFDLKANLPLRGIEIPEWNEILEIAVRCQEMSGLGYAGVDVALDRHKGPMVFELNCRPGLGIQVPNKAGLRFRLERVEGIHVRNAKHGVRISKNLFGGEVSEEIEKLSGKQIVNLVEKMTLYGKDSGKKKGIKLTVKGLLDTGKITSRIDKGTVAKIGYLDAIKLFKRLDFPKVFSGFTEAQEFIDEVERDVDDYPDINRLAKIVEEGKIKVRPVINIKLKVRGEIKYIEAVISSRKDLIYPVLLGRKELKEYLIDAGKTFVR